MRLTPISGQRNLIPQTPISKLAFNFYVPVLIMADRLLLHLNPPTSTHKPTKPPGLSPPAHTDLPCSRARPTARHIRLRDRLLGRTGQEDYPTSTRRLSRPIPLMIGAIRIVAKAAKVALALSANQPLNRISKCDKAILNPAVVRPQDVVNPLLHLDISTDSIRRLLSRQCRLILQALIGSPTPTLLLPLQPTPTASAKRTVVLPIDRTTVLALMDARPTRIGSPPPSLPTHSTNLSILLIRRWLSKALLRGVFLLPLQLQLRVLCRDQRSVLDLPVQSECVSGRRKARPKSKPTRRIGRASRICAIDVPRPLRATHTVATHPRLDMLKSSVVLMNKGGQRTYDTLKPTIHRKPLITKRIMLRALKVMVRRALSQPQVPLTRSLNLS
jgi:hypothetical protein